MRVVQRTTPIEMMRGRDGDLLNPVDGASGADPEDQNEDSKRFRPGDVVPEPQDEGRKQKKTPQKQKPYFTGTSNDGRTVFAPCQLTKGVYEGLKRTGTAFVQDWVVVEVTPAEAGTKSFELQDRDGKPYDTSTSDVFNNKINEVYEAMVNRYYEYNFKPHLGEMQLNKQDMETAVTFCKQEARRLIPNFHSIDDPLEPRTNMPVQAYNPLNKYAQKRRFNPSIDQDFRKKMYEWKLSPLKENDLVGAEERHEKSWNDKDFNVMIPNADNMFPVPVVQSIRAAMERSPSEITGSEGTGFLQAWRYDEEKNTVVGRNGADTTPEQYADWVKSFESVRQKMIEAYMKKWFKKGSDTMASGKTFAEYYEEVGFDPVQEAKRVIPPFHPKWGYQQVPSSFKLFASSASAKKKKKPGVGADDIDVKEVYNLQSGGAEDLQSRFDYLKLDTKIKVDGHVKKFLLNIPIDVLWVEDPAELKKRYRDGVHARHNPKVLNERKAKSKRKLEPMDPLKQVSEGTYLRLRIQVYLDRRERNRKHLSSLKKLSGEGSKDKRNDMIKDYKEKNRNEIERENVLLSENFEKVKKADVNVELSEEETTLKLLESGEEKVLFLRTLYHAKLLIFKQERDAAAEQAEKAKWPTEPIVLGTDAAESMDLEPADSALPLAPGQEGGPVETPYSEYSNDVREEIHFEYLNKLKSALGESPGEVALYAAELKLVVGRRKGDVKSRFERLSALSAEERAKERAEQLAAAAEVKANKTKRERTLYMDLSWEDKMERDKKARQRVRAIYTTSNSEDKLKTFDRFCKNLTAKTLVEAERSSRDAIYLEMYNELNNVVQGDKNKNLFLKLMGYVLQQTLKVEWSAFLEERRIENMTDEEKAAEEELKTQKDRHAVYNDHVKNKRIEEAIGMMEDDFRAELLVLENDKLESQKVAIDQFKNELNEEKMDPDKFRLFDRTEFADRVLDELQRTERDNTNEVRRQARRHVLLKAKLREEGDKTTAEALKAVGGYGTPAQKIVRTILNLPGIDDIVDKNTKQLLFNQEERAENNGKLRAQRADVLEKMYEDMFDQLDKGDAPRKSQTETMRKDLMGLAPSIQKDMPLRKKLEDIDKQLAEPRERADYRANIKVKGDQVLLAFQRFVESVKMYREVNESDTLVSFFNSGELEKKPDPLKPDPLKDGVPALAELAPLVLSDSFAALVLPIREKVKKKLEIADLVNQALEWGEDLVEKQWYEIEEGGEGDEEDKKDRDFIDDDLKSEEYSGVFDVDDEADQNLRILHKALAPSKSYDMWLYQIKKEFEADNAVNAVEHLVQLKDTKQNLADFVVVKKVGYYKDQNKGITCKLKKGQRLKPATVYELTGFRAKHKSTHESSRLEPFQRPQKDGTWYTPKYNEDDEEVNENDENGKLKITDVLHFVMDDLEGVPLALRPPKKYGKNNTGRHNGGMVERVSYFKPWDRMDTDDAQDMWTAWDKAKKAFDVSRKGFKISEMTKDGETDEEIMEKLRIWEPYQFFTLLVEEGYIVNVQLPDRYQARAGDGADVSAQKEEAKIQYDQFRLFLDSHFTDPNEGLEGTEGIMTSTSGGVADDEEEDDEEEDDEDDEDEEEDDEDDEDEEEDDDGEIPVLRENLRFVEFSDDSDGSDELDERVKRNSAAKMLPNLPEKSSDEDDSDYSQDDSEEDEEDDSEEARSEVEGPDGAPSSMDETHSAKATRFTNRIPSIDEVHATPEKREWWGYEAEWWNK